MFSNIQKKFSENKLFFVILSALFIFVNSTAFAADSKCAPRVRQLIEKDPVYAELFKILDPQVPQLKAPLAAVVDQATYQSLLDLARGIASSTPTGRVLLTFTKVV